MAENDLHNLDGLSEDDLMCFWRSYQKGRKYRELFPKGGRGARKAAADLANYASNKATAMRCREAGKINTAEYYERICDSIYRGLPEFARW